MPVDSRLCELHAYASMFVARLGLGRGLCIDVMKCGNFISYSWNSRGQPASRELVVAARVVAAAAPYDVAHDDEDDVGNMT